MQRSGHALRPVVSGRIGFVAHHPLHSPRFASTKSRTGAKKVTKEASKEVDKEANREVDKAPPHRFTPGTVEDVAVLGGGITGLATAYYLTREFPKARITVYEASDRLGGWISSKRVPVKDGNILFEAGPRTLRPVGNGVLAARLLQELDLAKDAIFPNKNSPAARNRYLYYPDHLVAMPHPSRGIVDNFFHVLREPIFEGAIWALCTEMSKNVRDPSLADESIGSFVERRYNKNIVDRILSGMIHGIYAGDVYKLSVKSLFPSLWRYEGKNGSVIEGVVRTQAEGKEVPSHMAGFMQTMQEYEWDPLLKATIRESTVFTFKDGLSMLTDGLIRSLWNSGNVEFKTSTAIESLVPADDKSSVLLHTAGSKQTEHHQTVVSALAPTTLNTLRPEGSSQLIPDIPYVTVMTVNLFFRTPDLHPPGFGYLIPRATPFENNPERALGVVFDNAYSPAPEHVDPKNWHVQDTEQLRAARERGQLINVNDFGWYNMPDKPNMQDDLPHSGTKLTVMLGGHWWDGWPSYPDEKEGLAMARSVLERHLGIKEEPEAWQVNLQKDCIPQYTVGHEQRLRTAHTNLSREYDGRLRVGGNWMAGVGVNDCLRSAWDVVQGLRWDKKGTGLELVGTTDYVRVKPSPRG